MRVFNARKTRKVPGIECHCARQPSMESLELSFNLNFPPCMHGSSIAKNFRLQPLILSQVNSQIGKTKQLTPETTMVTQGHNFLLRNAVSKRFSLKWLWSLSRFAFIILSQDASQEDGSKCDLVSFAATDDYIITLWVYFKRQMMIRNLRGQRSLILLSERKWR